MNITARNEFETIPAFTTIAGSTAGGWTEREVCIALLEAIDNVIGFSETFEKWKELAAIHDDDTLTFFMDELVEYFNESVDTMPEFCSLQWQDNELLIVPNVDNALDDTQTLDVIPDVQNPIKDDSGQTAYTITHVNDHGNVDLLQWDESKREYVIAWSVV